MMSPRRTLPLPLALIAAGALIMSACGGDGDAGSATTVAATEAVTADGFWARTPAQGRMMTAAYGEIRNDTTREVTVASVRADAGPAELHETLTDAAGMMSMRERPEGFVLAPGEVLEFVPGGLHVMLLDLDVPALLAAGEVRLSFEITGWGVLEVSAPLRESTMPEADHDHGDHEHGDDHEHHHGPEGMAGTRLDVEALHRLDDDLHAGIFDEDAQRQVVADALATLAVIEIPDGFDLAQLIAALEALDQALADGEIDEAADWAFVVHDLAHQIEPHHDHDHSHSHSHSHGHNR